MQLGNHGTEITHPNARHSWAHSLVGRWRLTAATILFIWLSVFGVGARPAVGADYPTIEVDVVPASLTYRPDTTGSVLIVVRNPSDTAVTDVTASWFTNTGLGDPQSLPTLPRLEPGAEYAWRLDLSAVEPELASGSFQVRVDYTWRSADNATPVAGIATGSIEITVSPQPAATDLIGAEVRSAGETIYEHRPGAIYLVLTNKSQTELKVTEVEVQTRDFIDVGLQNDDDELQNDQVKLHDKTFPINLQPGETRTITYDAQATDRARPGKQLVVFNVQVDSRGTLRNLVVSQEVDVAILGESDLLAVFQAPSLLLLPGLIIVAIGGLCWRLVLPGRKYLQPKEAEFWGVSVTLSLVVALLYPLVTSIDAIGRRFSDRPGSISRNYLTGYGFADIVALFVISLAVPIVVAAVVGTTLFVIRLRRQANAEKAKREEQARQQQAQEEEAARTPTRDDTPPHVLTKLAKQGLTVKRDLVKLKGETGYAFLLQERRADQANLWISPAILVKWLPVPPEKTTALYAAQEKLETLINSDGDPEAVAELLLQGQAEKLLEYRWDRLNTLDRPTLVEAAAISLTNQAALSIVKQAVS